MQYKSKPSFRRTVIQTDLSYHVVTRVETYRTSSGKGGSTVINLLMQPRVEVSNRQASI